MVDVDDGVLTKIADAAQTSREDLERQGDQTGKKDDEQVAVSKRRPSLEIGCPISW